MLGENPRFFSSKPRKGKSKPKVKVNEVPKLKSPSDSAPRLPPLPPMPRDAFPRYSPTSSTPLPPPSMPRKPLLRRSFPFLIAATAAYVLLRSPTKESSEKHEEVKMVSSIPVTSIESPVAEGSAQ